MYKIVKVELNGQSYIFNSEELYGITATPWFECKYKKPLLILADILSWYRRKVCIFFNGPAIWYKVNSE